MVLKNYGLQIQRYVIYENIKEAINFLNGVIITSIYLHISQVEELKEQLAKQEIELARKNEEADKLIEVVGIETEKVSKEKATADKEKIKVSEISKEVTIKQRDCAEDLKKAEPALIAAQEALNTLNKSNLTELKSFGSPPGAVVNVTAAVMVLMANNGRIPKDRSWAKAKAMMAKV